MVNQIKVVEFFYINSYLFEKLPTKKINDILILSPIYNLIDIYNILSIVDKYKIWFKYAEQEKKILNFIKNNKKNKNKKNNKKQDIQYFSMGEDTYNKIKNEIVMNNDMIILTGLQACKILMEKYNLNTGFRIKRGKFEFITNTPEGLIELISKKLGKENIKKIEVRNMFWTQYRDNYYRIYYKGVEEKDNIIDIYSIYNEPHSFNVIDNMNIANIYNIISNMLMQNIIVSNNKIQTLLLNLIKERNNYLKQKKLWGFEENSGMSVMQNNYLKGTWQCK